MYVLQDSRNQGLLFSQQQKGGEGGSCMMEPEDDETTVVYDLGTVLVGFHLFFKHGGVLLTPSIHACVLLPLHSSFTALDDESCTHQP